MLGHTFGASFSYVPQAHQDAAAAADPVPKFRARLLDLQVPEATLSAIEAAIDQDLDEAVEYALNSPYPDLIELRRDVLATEIAA
jgi:TPP-dependent pyruvate/acetoin dehydrogenase alpha subunit